MSNLKTLTSGLTAAALVAGIGFAYAQATNTEPAQTPSQTTTQQQPSTTTPPADTSTTPSTPSTTTSPSSDASKPMASEPAPQADRN